MPTLRSSTVSREVCLRKQLLNKIFLQTLSHDEPLDEPEPSSQAACLLIPPNSIRDQPAISEITEQDVEMQNEEVLLENASISSGSTEVQMISLENENCLTSYVTDSTTSSLNLQESLSSMVITCQPESATASSETYVPTVQKKSPRSSKKLLKKHSKILAKIETLERSVAIFCDKENEMPSGSGAFKSHNSISVFQNIKSSQQKKKYEKYFKRTLKVCTRLEGEITLYSQYVTTLETAVNTIPKNSKLSKMLEAKLKTAYKFHEENPSHEQLKTLMRQLKLVNLLLNKYKSESELW